MNPVDAYPRLMKWFHLSEAVQLCKTTTYELIHEMEAYQRTHKLPEKLVHRSPRGKGIRIDRDAFFRYYAQRENMTLPEELKHA